MRAATLPVCPYRREIPLSDAPYAAEVLQLYYSFAMPTMQVVTGQADTGHMSPPPHPPAVSLKGLLLVRSTLLVTI